MSLNRKQEGAISFMPTEIISQILSNDCLEAADLCRLSVTNKRLMQALQPILYSHIVLLSDQPMAVERLLRSLNENAHLLPLLRHLKLRSTPTCEWVAFPQSINLAFERILGFHLPALESLILEMAKIDINVYKINPTLPVRSIFINHASVEQAVMLLLLPHMEKIHIACIDDIDQLFYALDDHSISHFIPPKKSRFSTVRDIRIDQGFGPHTSLSPFIEWPRELQSLRISINTVNGLSPISVDNHLEPVRETLQDLSIVAYTNNATFDNTTFIHFEGFKHLAHLKITSSLLFRSMWNLATIERTGIFRHLPISLETLTVFFDHLADAIVTGREDAYTEIETPTDYFWILELTNLPKLRSLRLIEDLVSPDDSPNFKHFHWEPQSIVQNAFASHGIALQVLLRSYKQHNIDTIRRRDRIMAQRQTREAVRTRRH